MIDFVAVFVFFFAVIDPIGTVPVFIAVTRHEDERMKTKTAIRAAIVASVILVFFVIAGEFILDAMDVPLAAFQIAGGIVLFIFALTMIFGDSKPEEEVELIEAQSQTAIYPLAVPSLASPGAMLAAVLLTENAHYSVSEQVQTIATMLVVLLIAMLLMIGASRIHRLIGDSGASVISRVMGLILASVATASALAGIKEYFGV